ncbi:hypothetical protein [Streptomyces lydicus]|uniref:hypothetical protein n=1 Tax=Streptomyces lydicus TaxID=47763 RepID=UPI0037A3A7F7
MPSSSEQDGYIVHDVHTSCQLSDAGTGVSSQISIPGQRNDSPQTAPDATWTPVRGDDQELAATASRRTGPRRWLRAVTWLISAGLHPKANATTLRLAEDLAARMDFDTGWVLYGLDRLAARLRISRATAKRHVKYLRELGALVFVTHGTQRNSRRARGLEGYAPTATTYAATIPVSYDHAMGHRIIGTGYEARIVIDQRGQTPVENAGTETGREPLSLTVEKEEGKLKMVGGVTTTGKPAANESTSPTKASSKKRATILGAKVTAAGAQLADTIARTLRSRLPWLRRASHDQVRWICADMGERGWTVQQAVQFASDTAAIHGRGAGLMWQPDRPHALLAAGLRDREQQHLEDTHRAYGQALETAPMSNETWEALWAAQRTTPAPSAPKPHHTDDDRRTARMYGWQDFAMVADHYDDDPDDALDLYGTQLCTVAIRQTSTRQETYA